MMRELVIQFPDQNKSKAVLVLLIIFVLMNDTHKKLEVQKHKHEMLPMHCREIIS